MILRLNIISVFLLLFGAFQHSMAQQEFDCSDFKTGTYHYIPPNGGEVYLKRTKKKQIERYNDENQKFIFTIEWIDECTYKLTLKNAKGLPKAKKKEIIGSTLFCKVIDANLGHYTVNINNSDNKTSEEVIIYSNR